MKSICIWFIFSVWVVTAEAGFFYESGGSVFPTAAIKTLTSCPEEALSRILLNDHRVKSEGGVEVEKMLSPYEEKLNSSDSSSVLFSLNQLLDIVLEKLMRVVRIQGGLLPYYGKSGWQVDRYLRKAGLETPSNAKPPANSDSQKTKEKPSVDEKEKASAVTDNQIESVTRVSDYRQVGASYSGESSPHEKANPFPVPWSWAALGYKGAGWRVPVPPESIELLPEPLIKTLQDPDSSIQWFQQEQESRQRMEESGEEYTLEALRTTLLNMERFVVHILDNRQFELPLNQEERSVFENLHSEIKDFLECPALPYQRTVLLTYKFTMLYDFMMCQKIFPDGPVSEHQTVPYGVTFTQWNLLSGNITLTELSQLCSLPFDNNDQPGSFTSLLESYSYYDFIKYLNSPGLLLFPSYAPLDLEDFADFGHLPFCPLSMMTDYVLNADGYIRSPLTFYNHDIVHITATCSWSSSPSAGLLRTPESRLYFREALMGGALTCPKKLEKR